MGIVGGPRTYDGPPIAGWAPWKCPACTQENTGAIEAGCVHCGSGSAPARHVGMQPPGSVQAKTDLHLSPKFQAIKADMARGIEAMDERAAAYSLAETWAAQHTEATIAEAFASGYLLATQQAQGHTMAAPPVTADVTALPPEGRTNRTIVAALELFRDQILPTALEEIAMGEWLTAAEVEELIERLKRSEE